MTVSGEVFENRSAAKNTFVRTLGRFCRKYHLAELSYPLLDEREKPKSSCRNLHFPYAESGVYPLYTVPEAQADPSSRHQPDATDFANVAARIDEGFLGQAEVLKCDARREGQRLNHEWRRGAAFSCSVRLPRGSLEPEVAKAICRRFVVHSLAREAEKGEEKHSRIALAAMPGGLLPKATPRCKKPRIATFRVHIPGSGLDDKALPLPVSAFGDVLWLP